MAKAALSGKRAHVPVVQSIDGVVYRDCPAWVPLAVRAVVESGCVPNPAEITWHPKPLKTLLGRCWPSEGRIHVHPHSGEQWRVEESIDVDVSGEIRGASSRGAWVPGQDATEVEDTLAHELAHLVHARHGPQHRALTERIARIVRASRGVHR